MEKMGKYLLNSREIECKWQPTDNAKPVEMIKKKLSGNQIVIAYLRKSKNVSSYILKPVITDKVTGKSFKPMANVKFEIGGKYVDFVYEIIRRNENWKQELADRMRQWKDFYDNFAPGDSGYGSIPQLIFVCEDDIHMAEVFKELVINQLSINKIRFYFTTDLEQNKDKLDKSLYEFVEEEGKYKKKNIEAKILG